MGQRHNVERGNTIVSLLVVIGGCLLIAAGVRFLGSKVEEVYFSQAETVKRLEDFAPQGPGAGSSQTGTDIMALGGALGGAAASSLHESLRASSDLVNPLSPGFVGARLNSAGRALANLVINPSDQMARESAAVKRMWSGLKQAAAGATETLWEGSPEERAALAGTLIGAAIDPLRGTGKISRITRVQPGRGGGAPSGRASPLTRKSARALAEELGFKEVKDAPFRTRGQPAFKNGSRYITPDRDVHRGGSWKLFDRKGNRLGTYNDDLSVRIGD